MQKSDFPMASGEKKGITYYEFTPFWKRRRSNS